MGSELACVYAALILHDEGLEITAENMNKILAAAKVEVEAYWPTLFCKLCAGKDIGTIMASVGSGGGGGGGGGGGDAPAAAPAGGGGGSGGGAKEKEPEPEEEEEDMGFDLVRPLPRSPFLPCAGAKNVARLDSRFVAHPSRPRAAVFVLLVRLSCP